MPYSHLLDQPTSPQSRKIERCECGAPVSLVKPNRALPATPWRCIRCSAIILANPQRRDGSEFRGGVRRADFFEIYERSSPQYLASPSRLSDEDIKQLRDCVECSQLPEHELRQSPRFAIAAALSVVPLNGKFGVSGPPAVAYSIDVSTGGMAILHPEPTGASLYAIEFIDPILKVPPVILRPIRCSRLGNGFAIAGDFVCRIDY